MKGSLFIAFELLVVFFSPGLMGEDKIIIYPAPSGESVNMRSLDKMGVARNGYRVFVNGNELDIYRASSPMFEGGEYFFTYFDFKGRVNVEVYSGSSLDKAELFPKMSNLKKGGVGSIKGERMSFSADRPFSAVLAREGREMPLIIFGNPIESDIPKSEDPNMIRFDAGTHVLESPIKLKDNQTLYVAGGAVVKGTILAKGKNISIRGRGIISGSLFPRFARGHFVRFENCENVTVKDVIITEPFGWTLVVQDCKKVLLEGVKICSSRMLNDDAIDICNSSDVLIEKVFARAQDDIVAVKGTSGKNPCENILVRDCIFWTDFANIFRIGYECNAPKMSNINFKNIFIPFYSVNMRPPEDYWSNSIIWLQPSGDMPMENIKFDGIKIHSDGSDMIVLMANPRVVKYSGYKVAGRLSNCSVKNLTVEGSKGKFKGILYFKGWDEERSVKNFSLENINYFGKKIGKDSPNVKIFPDFADKISFE